MFCCLSDHGRREPKGAAGSCVRVCVCIDSCAVFITVCVCVFEKVSDLRSCLRAFLEPFAHAFRILIKAFWASQQQNITLGNFRC